MERMEEIRQRRERHSDLLDDGGTEVALIGGDIDWLIKRAEQAETALAASRAENAKPCCHKEEMINELVEKLRDVELAWEQERGEIWEQFLLDLDEKQRRMEQAEQCLDYTENKAANLRTMLDAEAGLRKHAEQRARQNEQAMLMQQRLRFEAEQRVAQLMGGIEELIAYGVAPHIQRGLESLLTPPPVAPGTRPGS